MTYDHDLLTPCNQCGKLHPCPDDRKWGMCKDCRKEDEIDKELGDVIDDLLESQHPLPSNFQKVLDDNLWELMVHTEETCPRCGQEYDGNRCLRCGYCETCG